MDQIDLQKLVSQHNTGQIAMGLVLVPGSMALWLASFWTVRILVAFPLFAFGFPFWRISFYAALAFLVLLAIEGVRYGKPLFDLREYTRSAYFDIFAMQTESGRALSSRTLSLPGEAYLVSQALFCAPRTAVHAVRAFRSLVPRDEATVAEAAQILTELEARREWVLASRYSNRGAALMLLDRMRLIWVDIESGETRIRYPAGID